MRALSGSPLIGLLCGVVVGACGGPSESPPICDQSQCGPKKQCLGKYGSCVAVECGSVVLCEDPSKICDESQNRCFPSNGDCTNGEICPTFGIASAVSITCSAQDALCHAVPVGATLSPPVSAKEPIAVSEPTPGQVFDSATSVRFTWTAISTPVLVEILKGAVAKADDLSDSIVWGAAILKDDAPSVDWSRGQTVVDGSWESGSPRATLPDGPYFVLVQAVQLEELVAVSSQIPIWIGQGTSWTHVGDSCSKDGVPGSCWNPAEAQACVNSTCAKVCASQPDCTPLGLSCQTPWNGFRTCG
jgi:hypothetical protein